MKATVYRAVRDFLRSMDDTLPGRFEITRDGIVHDLTAPNGPHELTTAHIRKRLEGVVLRRPRTGTGAVFSDIHPTPGGPRYATRKDFVYGEDVTIADWSIPTGGLPRYQGENAGAATS
ncbi:hypothetical protein [Streptomyces sp. E-15]